MELARGSNPPRAGAVIYVSTAPPSDHEPRFGSLGTSGGLANLHNFLGLSREGLDSVPPFVQLAQHPALRHACCHEESDGGARFPPVLFEGQARGSKGLRSIA